MNLWGDMNDFAVVKPEVPALVEVLAARVAALESERDALLADYKALRALCDALEENKVRHYDYEMMRTERDALLEDKRRLDWIQDSRAEIYNWMLDGKMIFTADTKGRSFRGTPFVRESIDTARKESEAGDATKN